ncbi:specific RNA polymerase II transcription factor, putative [Cryptococcus gattii WM276]|uniref:Specific RNA polymerase II transcription factor, putative n=1 Tax=Cryptococcus gattii serotype B (strain WM276 / ATCC MYA-4071) TaxID=367775 RepID=E6RAN3_CRYGW|nr:specific RNA polymerase II transcription factor, putative [Cryptococcus gattii WM276]ADV23934.1 specific RNA polymerase II transcription factor, putative [Cryptococcus gattii WM276]
MNDLSAASREKVRRGYRACLHCRSRKAKCDLGDIDAPSSPPCSRCKRESRECVFAPSRRGGNNKKRARTDSEDISKEDDDPPRSLARSTAEVTSGEENPAQTFPYPQPPPQPRHLSVHNLLGHSPPPARYLQQFGHTSSSTHSSPQTSFSAEHATPQTRPTLPSIQSHTATGYADSPPSPRRKRMANPPLHAADPSSIVVADMRNESDALQILALASGQAANREGEEERSDRYDGQSAAGTVDSTGMGGHQQQMRGIPSSPEKEIQLAKLAQFPLVKMGILSVEQTRRLVDMFFKCHHHFFPIIPSDGIPRTLEQLSVFAQNEKYLLATIIIISSRVENTPEMREIHERSWSVMRRWISKVQCLGEPPTIGLVESLLLLAENLPRTSCEQMSDDSTSTETEAIEEPHGVENRQAWQMIGLAVRSAYEMGLDKLGLQLIPETERTLELERAKLVWVYCYLFDRHISMRLGKGFWTRGGAVCFQGYSSSAQTGPAAALVNFPFLREIKPGDPNSEHPQDDLGSLVQAYLELTMMMSNAHDVLYPNAARTRSLVVYGEYFKYIDEMARSLDGFKILWRRKKWTLFPLTDTVWVMFYYIQLYICAFSFQAHVERATIRGEEEYKILEQRHREQGGTTKLARPSLTLFPRGAAQSPDARYIFQMCDTARELIHICVDNLYPGGALPYLPSRYLLWFTYGAIVLLKAIYSGAMLRADHKRTLDLIDRLCICFAQCSTDEEYPAVRYGKQLEALRNKLAGLSDVKPTHSPGGGGGGGGSGSQTVRLSRTQQNRAPEVRVSPLSPSQQSATSPNTLPPPQQFDPRPSLASSQPARYHVMPSEHAMNTPAWQLPVMQQYTQPVTFPYPTTPVPIPAGPSAEMPAAPYVAPPHQQPFMEFGVAQSSDGLNLGMSDHNNLGFTSLDDWFGFGAAGTGGGAGQDGNGVDDPMGLANVGLDLQDFWMNVGPGEAQGGFPFR